MNLETFTYLLEHPERITAAQTIDLEKVLDEFPYFQSARALYLKGLKKQESYLYNNALKRTAVQTQDRSVLFDFITSTQFIENSMNQTVKFQKEHLLNMTVHDALNLSQQVETEELEKAHTILDPGFFVPKEIDQKEKDSLQNLPNTQIPEEVLQQGKPLDFTKQETHSFNEWLQITSLSPINRKETSKDNAPSKTANNPERKRKIKLIDRFIATNPKIKIKPKEEIQHKNVIPEAKNVPSEQLMTETLARVYVEQKNYKKARQAFKILSLKYPEKSGFFADQIRAIEQLQDQKK